MRSSAHIKGAAAEDPKQRTLIDVKNYLREEEKGSYIAALKTVYWIAVEEIANRKYASLLELQRQQGVQAITNLKRGRNSTKESPQVFNELLAAIDKVNYKTKTILSKYCPLDFLN